MNNTKLTKKQTIQNLRTALSESDRVNGELMRELSTLRATNQAQKIWTANAKTEAGYDQNTSFDDVWRHVFRSAQMSALTPSGIPTKAVEWCVEKLTAELNVYLKSNLLMVVSPEKLAQIHTGVMYHIKDILTHEVRDINGEATPEE